MAPEMFGDGPPTVSTDVYALGVLAYLWLSGVYPIDLAFVPENRVPSLVRETSPVEIALHCRDIDAPTARLIMSMLAKSPDRRPPTMTAVAEACRRATDRAELDGAWAPRLPPIPPDAETPIVP